MSRVSNPAADQCMRMKIVILPRKLGTFVCRIFVLQNSVMKAKEQVMFIRFVTHTLNESSQVAEGIFQIAGEVVEE